MIVTFTLVRADLEALNERLGYLLGLYGKYNGNDYRGNIGIMQKNMETTTIMGYIGFLFRITTCLLRSGAGLS